MKLLSSAFQNNQSVPSKYTCQGENTNPELQISEAPEAAKTLALIMHDPDAPMPGGFTHWVVYNIPPNTNEILENTEPTGTAGMNGADKTGYAGPCPPSGQHRYFFKLYALDNKLDIQSADKSALEKAMAGHIIDQAELVGLYQKQ